MPTIHQTLSHPFHSREGSSSHGKRFGKALFILGGLEIEMGEGEDSI